MSFDTRRALDAIRSVVAWGATAVMSGLGIQYIPADALFGAVVGGGVAVLAVYVIVASR